MAGIKNIAIPKVNVDTKKMMGAATGLVDKIPPQIQDLIRKIVISLFFFFLIMAIYIGWSKGWENAKPQGMQLAQDTRSLFMMEIEKDYNRKRKDVRMSDPEDLTYESNRRMQFDFISEREMGEKPKETLAEEKDFLGKEYDFRNQKTMDSTIPPIYTPSGDGLIPAPIDVEPRTTSESDRESEQNINDDIRMQKMLERVSELEKKLKAKNEEKNLKNLEVNSKSDNASESKATNQKQRTLERIPKGER
ncbi:hypothetical protein P3G55_03565 [Leptospira sp. 96542]|nr:hypothetical protein [Leptospira sp. 96542]